MLVGVTRPDTHPVGRQIAKSVYIASSQKQLLIGSKRALTDLSEQLQYRASFAGAVASHEVEPIKLLHQFPRNLIEYMMSSENTNV